MIFEGVNFNETAIRGMTKGDFIDSHSGVLWQDRGKAERETMLSDVWNIINGVKESAEEAVHEDSPEEVVN